MSKTKEIISINFEKAVMAKVKSNEISMKPRWYFVAGSFLTMVGLVGFSIGAVFLTNLTLFLLRKHGPMGQVRIQLMVQTFPWWIPVLAICGAFFGVWLLKKYDFSYKKNFWLIALGFIVSIVVAAYIIDFIGLNDVWSKQGPMRRFYQQIDFQGSVPLNGRGKEIRGR